MPRTDRLAANDPIAWCCVNNNDLFSLAESVNIAILAAKRKKRALRPFQNRYRQVEWLPRNYERKQFSYSETRLPPSPLFWRQLGHNPTHSRRLAQCCPEYWLRQGNCSWKSAVALATRRLKALASQLKSEQHNFYRFARTYQYPITKRDPAYWFSEGCDWDQALRKAITEAFGYLPEAYEHFFHLRTLVRKAGPRAELLRDGTIHLSGPSLGYQKHYDRRQKARAKALRDGPPTKNWPRWGPIELDSPIAAHSHCSAVGPARGGTDLLLHILMNSVAADRWLVLDGRNDLLPTITAIRPEAQVHSLNPLDARTSAWNLSGDAATPQQVQKILATFLPADPHSDPLVLQSARALLEATIQALNTQAPGNWGLHHLLAAIEPRNLKHVLTSNSATTEQYKAHLDNPHHRLVSSFLQSRLEPLKPVAAAWRHATRTISVTAWLQSCSVLLLATSFRHQHVLAPLNRLLFHLIAGNLIEPRNVFPLRTWVFLSDLSQIGRLEPLPALLSQGPAVNVTVAITVEDIEMLQRHYPSEATAILGLCGNYALLRITNPLTARWASQLLGTEKVQLFYRSEGTLSGKTSQSLTTTKAERPLVTPTEFQELPLPQPDRGPVGYFKSPNRRTYKGAIDLDQFRHNQWLSAPPADFPAFVPCPQEHLQLPDDTGAFLATLGFSPHSPSHRPSKRLRRQQPAEPDLFADDTQAQQQGESDFDPRQFPRLDLPLD